MLAELRTLIAVSKHGTFAGAGDRIGLTQAAVSGHVKRLEEHLGFPLFDRTGRTARLNGAGRRTLDRAREIVALVDAIGDPEDEPTRARVRIGAIASAQAAILPRALDRFRKLFPAAHVRIVPGVSIHLLDQLDAGELDIALIIRPPFQTPPHIGWRTVAREPLVLLVPEAVAGEDWRRLIAEQPFLRYDRTSFGGRQVDRMLRAEGVDPREVVELDELPAITAMVAAGIGVAIAPLSPLSPPPPPGVRVVPLGLDAAFRELGVAVAVDMDGAGPAAALVDLIVRPPGASTGLA